MLHVDGKDTGDSKTEAGVKDPPRLAQIQRRAGNPGAQTARPFFDDLNVSARPILGDPGKSKLKVEQRL